MRVVIIGGGFAGLAAARRLYNLLPFEAAADEKVQIVLIDRNEYSTMLPSLPEVAGNRLPYRYIKEDIKRLMPRGVEFLNKVVTGVDFNNKRIYLSGEGEDKDKSLEYDYLIFTPGSKAKLDDSGKALKSKYTLECLEDALRIREDFYRFINKNDHTNIVISGAGYTGIELACNLYDFAAANHRMASVTLVEKAERILPELTETESGYVAAKLSQLGFRFITGDEIVEANEGIVTLKSGAVIKNSFLCWCVGVKTSIPAEGRHKTLEDGRIIVDSFLRVPEHPEVFAAGDTAAVKKGRDYIRRSIYSSCMEGWLAGRNAAACIKGFPIKPYKSKERGFIIPLYITSIGERFGHEFKGRIGILLHFLACGSKSYNFRSFRKYIKCGLKFVFSGPAAPNTEQTV